MVVEGEGGNITEYVGCNAQPENVNIHDVKQATYFAASYTQSKRNLYREWDLERDSG